LWLTPRGCTLEELRTVQPAKGAAVTTDAETTPRQRRNLSDELVDYHVEGKDGTIGRVQHVTYDGSCLVVRTGRLFGNSHVVPALAVQAIDPAARRILLDLTVDDVRGAPEYDSHLGYDEDCQSRAEAHYGPILLDRVRAEDLPRV
jgi:hypothetical protein